MGQVSAQLHFCGLEVADHWGTWTRSEQAGTPQRCATKPETYIDCISNLCKQYVSNIHQEMAYDVGFSSSAYDM